MLSKSKDTHVGSLFRHLTDMMRLSLSEAMGAGLRFGLILAVRAYIGLEWAGVYIFGITLGLIIGLIADFGQSQYMIRSLSADPDGYSTRYGSALWFRLIASGILLALIFSAGLAFPYLWEKKAVIFLCCVTGLNFKLIETCEGVWLATGKAAKAALYRFIWVALVFGTPLVLVIAEALPFVAVISIQAILGIILVMTYHFRTRREFGPVKLKFDGPPFKQWKQGWALGANLMLIEINVRSPLLIIEWILNSVSVGIYGIIERLQSIIEVVMINFVKIAFPALSRDFYDKEINSRQWRLPWIMTFMMLVPAIIGAALLTIFAEKVVIVFIGESSIVAIHVLIVMTWAKVMSLTKRPLYVTLLSYGKERLMSAINLLMVIITISGAVLLLPAIGLTGAAWTYLVAEAVAVTAILGISVRLSKASLSKNN